PGQLFTPSLSHGKRWLKSVISVISYQLSVISYQLSVISYHLLKARGKRQNLTILLPKKKACYLILDGERFVVLI
ncbi:MAG: hypothetical protein ACKPBT_22530, partial [Microcystis aeruginosa]